MNAWFALCPLAAAGPALEPGAVELDPPTLVALGVRWAVTGDDDHDAAVSVRWREPGGAWAQGPALFRVRPEHVYGRTVRAEFAGTVFDLRPATAYELELTATDPDGGGTVVTIEGTTRPVPADPLTPRAVPVATAGELQDALDDAAPGDVITLADGTYRGPFGVYADGTATDPIVIRGATQDGTVLTGDGCPSCNVLEVYGSHTHVERLTLADANRALRFQGEGAVGNVVRHVHARDVGLGFGGDVDQRDFTLCDNVLEGPLAWPHVYADDGGQFSNVDGIVVMGTGHAVCHNRLSGWGDALKMGQDGGRSVDFYGNDVSAGYDNGLELDGGEGNVRAWRNRFTNTYATLSFQPVYGGPAYVLRNLVVNVAHEQLKLHSLGGTDETSGILVLHNTFVSAERALRLYDSTTSHHFEVRGNLFVGSPSDRTVEWTGGIDEGTFDGNGWWPDGRYDFGDAGDWPSFAQMQAAGAFEVTGVLLDAPPLAVGPPADYTVELAPADPTPVAGSRAIDGASPIPGVSDGFVGAAPDLGAQEVGCPVPVYGPRPEGVDERADDWACGTATTPTTTDPTTDPTTGPPTETTPDSADPPAGDDDRGPGGCGCAGAPTRAGVLVIAAALTAGRRRRSTLDRAACS